VTPGASISVNGAIRLAVNIAMYVLCSNYKDDQVHAPFLMRRRAVEVSVMIRTWALSQDLSRPLALAAIALALFSLLLLGMELRRRWEKGLLVALTGICRHRPSRSFRIATGHGAVARKLGRAAGGSAGRPLAQSRFARRGRHSRQALVRALGQIRGAAGQARLRVLGFGQGPAVPWIRPRRTTRPPPSIRISAQH